MSKKPKSFTVDEDIHEELSERADLNASAIVNNYLREFLDATDRTESEVIISEINRQIEEVDNDIQELKKKRERLVNRRERVRSRDKEQRESDIQEILDKAANVPAEPDHPFIVENAESVDMTPEELAREIADYHGKEYDPSDDDNGLRSL